MIEFYYICHDITTKEMFPMARKLYFILLLLYVFVVPVMAQPVHVRSRNFTTRDGLGSNVVNNIMQDRQGYLWIGTNHGLTRFDGHRFENFYVEKDGERRVEGITAIVEDTTKNVLLMAGKGYSLLCFDLKRMQFVDAEGMEYPMTDDKRVMESIYTERAEKIGIQRGNITQRRHDLHYARLNDGREIFTTIDNGFYLFEPSSNQLYHYCSSDNNPIIESDYINDVFIDRSGSVWLATTFAGIYQLNLDEGQLRYHTLTGSTGNIRSFSELPDGTLAVGDMDGNVFRYDPQTHESKLIFRKGPRAYAMRTDRKGRFWVGTRGGGVWVDDRHLNATDGLAARQIFDVCIAANGTAWIGTFDGGLVEAKEQSDGSFSYTPHLPKEGIHQILIDRKGSLWVATESGVFRRDGTEFKSIFNKGKVVCITQGPADTIYAGSNGYGLLVITKDKVKHFTTSDGLANNCVEAIAVDKDGNIIAATDQGVSIIKHKDGIVQNVYSPLGLLADTYNEDAILCTSDGRLFLGSQRGLAELKVSSSLSHNKRNNPAPCLTSIDINDVPRYDGLTDDLRLSYNQNNLCFNFSSFAYKELSSVIYSYWFEGIDRNWRSSTHESRALYTELRPGHYRFHVRYRLSGEQWSPESICDVYIAQPWWWTWWARAIYLLVFALIVWYEWHQYQRRLSLQRQLDQRLSVLYASHASEPSAPQLTPLSEGDKPKDGSSFKNRAFLDKLDQLILSNLLKSDLDMNYIAQEMCVSYSTLHRRIKSITGMTGNEYVRKHRLAKAMQLLHDGHNATEVAQQCGFNSPSYFTRCFKSEYGIPPSEV